MLVSPAAARTATISRTRRRPSGSLPTCTTRSTLAATMGTTKAWPMFSPASSGRVHILVIASRALLACSVHMPGGPIQQMTPCGGAPRLNVAIRRRSSSSAGLALGLRRRLKPHVRINRQLLLPHRPNPPLDFRHPRLVANVPVRSKASLKMVQRLDLLSFLLHKPPEAVED